MQVIQENLSDPQAFCSSFSTDQISAVRSKILEFFSHLVYPEKYLNGSTSLTHYVFPVFLLNKTAQVIASIIAALYPDQWPNAFKTTVLPLVNANLQTEASTAMFFRVLRAVDDDVTSIRATLAGENARKTSIRVKDAMRDDCITDLVAACAKKLASPQFSAHAFDFFARYVEWVDIGLIANEKVLRPAYTSITSTTYSPSRSAAATTIRSIVTKRMNPTSKINLMKHMDIEALLRAIPVNEIMSHEDESSVSELSLKSGQVEIAALVNTTALVALDVFKNSIKEGSTTREAQQMYADAIHIAQTALPVALRFLHENTEEETSSQTIESITTYVNVFSRAHKKGADSFNINGMGAVGAILKVVEERALFAKDFDPNMEGSDEQDEFLRLRNVLLKTVYKSVVRAFPELCLQFVKNSLSSASAGGDIPRVELAMSMILILLSTCPDTPSAADIRRDLILNPPPCMRFTTDLPTASMDKVQLAQMHQLERISSAYFDLAARSYRMFLTRSNPELLSAVLSVFFSEIGLGHSTSELVRSQATYALLKLIRPLRSIVTTNHLEAILNFIPSYVFPLDLDANSKQSKNQMMLFEVLGYLLGTDQKREKSLQYLRIILQPLVERLNSITGPAAVPLIMACGFLSKGFGGDSKPLVLLNDSQQDHGPDPSTQAENVKFRRLTPPTGAVQKMWLSCLEAVLRSSAPAYEKVEEAALSDLRSKCLFFLHRMVDTISSPVLPYLEQVLPGILSSSAGLPVHLRDVIILVSQAISKFGDDCEKMIMCVYIPIVQSVHKHPYTLDQNSLMAVSEESRESVEMHRAYSHFLHAIVGTKLIATIIHPKHTSMIRGVMTSLLGSAQGELLDVRVASSVSKMCLNTLGLMVRNWCTNQENEVPGPPGFREFALKEISKVTALCGVRGSMFQSWDYSNGQSVAVLTEVVTLQKICADHLGPEFAGELKNGPWRNLPQQEVGQYLRAVYSNDITASKLVPTLASFCQRLRKG